MSNDTLATGASALTLNSVDGASATIIPSDAELVLRPVPSPVRQKETRYT
jgi:hypothetical protein